MPKKPLDVETLWKLPRVGAPVPSPDGKRVIVPVALFDMEANEGTTRLWLVPTEADEAGSGRKGDPARALTTADVSSGAPAWSADGTRIAFTRKPGGSKSDGKKKKGPRHPDVPQLYVMRVDGGEPERLTDLPFGVESPRFFPDGERIAFASAVYEAAPDPEGSAKRKKEREEDPVKAYVTEDRFYRYWDQWLTERRFLHLFVLDLETAALADLTPACFRVHGLGDGMHFAIAPDGREIAFSGVRSAPPYDELLDAVYALKVPKRVKPDAAAPRIREITKDHPASAFRPVYSPDGRWMVYGIQYETDFYADRVRLVALQRESGEKTVLTEDWDASAQDWCFGADASALYLCAEVDARSAVYRLNLAAAVKDPKRNPPREIVRGRTYAGMKAAGSLVVASRSSLREPPEVYVVEPRTKTARRLTAFTAKVMKDLLLSRVEDVRFAGAEGVEVQMFVLLPPGERLPGKNAKRTKKWPLVHMIHGGPHGTFGDVWHWRWNAQAFAAPGYVVACVNFHGSTSFGERFTSSILGRWGDQPYHDIIAATDHLSGMDIVKRKKMAISGGSYGGYLVSWIASQTDRFACAVNHAGVCDFQTQYASDVTHGRARSMGGEPWDDLKGMDGYNPMRYASGFRTPMLILHGTKDYRVPADQALEIYGVYKARKLPSRLVVYPDENHWILKPKNSRHWYGEVLDWFARFL